MATCQVSEENVVQNIKNILTAIGAGGSKTFTIVAVGKPGCGKSTLIGDILGPHAKEKPLVGSGKDPVTMETSVYTVLVDDVSVRVCDTRGLFDTLGGNHEEETIEIVNGICTNDRSGVVLICMDMHGRTDVSTAETLALLHKNCGPEIWRFVLIALTKANNYPEENWLEKKGRWELPSTVLKREFENCLEDNKQHIQRLFTDTEKTKESCRIGMSIADYEALRIPILPVARLHPKDATKKMETVGYGTWFTYLILQCTLREREVGLVTIHKDRLSYLPRKIEKLLKEQIEPFIEAGRQLARNCKLPGQLYLLVVQKAFWWRNRTKMICGARFERAHD